MMMMIMMMIIIIIIIIIGYNSSNEARFSATFVNYGDFSNENQGHIGIILLSDQKTTNWEEMGLFSVF